MRSENTKVCQKASHCNKKQSLHKKQIIFFEYMIYILVRISALTVLEIFATTQVSRLGLTY